MHCHCQLSNLSFCHSQLPLNHRKVTAPGTGASLSTCTPCQAAATRGGTLTCCVALLGAPGYQSMLQPSMAPSSFPESTGPVPSGARLPLLQAAQGFWLTWFGIHGDKGECVCPMKWVPLASLEIHRPGRQTPLARQSMRSQTPPPKVATRRSGRHAWGSRQGDKGVCALLPQNLLFFS